MSLLPKSDRKIVSAAISYARDFQKYAGYMFKTSETLKRLRDEQLQESGVLIPSAGKLRLLDQAIDYQERILLDDLAEIERIAATVRTFESVDNKLGTERPGISSFPSFSLLVLDLADKVVVKVERGHLDGVPNALDGVIHSDGVTVFQLTFDQFKHHIENRALPRIERCGTGMRFIGNDSSVTEFTREAMNELSALGVVVPRSAVSERGNWVRLDGLVDDSLFKVWRYVR